MLTGDSTSLVSGGEGGGGSPPFFLQLLETNSKNIVAANIDRCIFLFIAEFIFNNIFPKTVD
ncbi:MAG: hypothetical protein DI535_06870 [Citrobacter freundii]|nr:MAG: hypothetical protein DI535_06870 [Citrobacter freundii]